MKKLITIIWISVIMWHCSELYSQDSTYLHLYKHAIDAPPSVFRGTHLIAEYLEPAASNDRDFIMLFYYWVADNILYDLEKYLSGDVTYTDVFHTIATRKTMCQGYAELLCELCEQVDIKCEIIRGYAKGFGYDGKVYDEINHLWNAVFVDNQWHLMDFTWGCGIIERKRLRHQFVQKLREEFVFADPETLILTHFPVDEKWQLLENPITKEGFFSRQHDQKRIEHMQVVEEN